MNAPIVVRLVVAAGFAVGTLPALAQFALYSASSKAQGAAFDLVVTETRRELHKSIVSVPGFHGRTAAGSRWLMCTYTDLAVKRGFSHWSVVYPEPGKEGLVLVFSHSASASPQQLFGADYRKDLVLGEKMTPVDKFAAFCGLRK